VAKVDPYGAVYYFFSDQIGSTRVMPDAAGRIEQVAGSAEMF
jgi:hypothetical protein